MWKLLYGSRFAFNGLLYKNNGIRTIMGYIFSYFQENAQICWHDWWLKTATTAWIILFWQNILCKKKYKLCKVKLAVASRASYPYHGFPLDPLGGLQGLLDLSWIRLCRKTLEKLNLFSLTFWIIWCYWCENGWICPWYKNHVLRCWDDGRYWTSLQLSISTKW